MNNPDKTSQKVQSRRNALNEEQQLCHDALQSSEFDSISDEQWVALCEMVASKGRLAGEPLVAKIPPVVAEEDED